MSVYVHVSVQHKMFLVINLQTVQVSARSHTDMKYTSNSGTPLDSALLSILQKLSYNIVYLYWMPPIILIINIKRNFYPWTQWQKVAPYNWWYFYKTMPNLLYILNVQINIKHIKHLVPSPLVFAFSLFHTFGEELCFH